MTQLRDLVLRVPKRGLEFPPWLERLVSIGIVTTDKKLVRRQRCVNVAGFAVAGSALSHLVFNSLHDFHGLLIINAYNMMLICGGLLVPLLHRFGENVAAFAVTLLVVIVHSLIVWSFGLESDLQVYFTLGGAVLFFFGVQNWRLFLFFFGLFVIALLIALNFAPVDGLVIPEDHAFRDVLSNQAMVNTIAINAALLFYALSALDRTEVDLENENDRSEALIHNVMPAAIAARLKSGREERIADRIETLSVLFADLVGFSSAVHDLPPDEVVEYLDRLVCLFDELAQRHGVEKIKTIGDNYMAAAGFDGRAFEGAVAVGKLALAMREIIERQPPLGGRKLRMRVGIHCGVATAGVIGATRFSYDVWGDAVNFASRMESHGLPDQIQVSEVFRDLTRDAFLFQERGTTDLKGLGAARTFLLVGERLPCQASRADRGDLDKQIGRTAVMSAEESKHPIVHFVGSIPLPDAETVFRTLSGAVGKHLVRLPDGETGIRKTWIRFLQDVLSENPAIEFATDVPPFKFVQWDGKVVREIPRQRIKPGATPDPKTFKTGYADMAIESWALFERLQKAGEIPAQVKFQISIPTPIAPTYNNMVPADRPKLLPALTRHFIGEVEKIARSLPNDRIALQWDVCQEVLAWEGYYEPGPVDFKTETIDVLGKIGDAVPAGIELGYHLCYGSPADEHMVQPKDTGIMVEMTNAIVARVSRPIQFFHLPVPKGRTDDAYFAPLNRLQLGPQTELYLGLIHHNDAEGDAARLAAARRHVRVDGIATECGMARGDPARLPELLAAHARAAERRVT